MTSNNADWRYFLYFVRGMGILTFVMGPPWLASLLSILKTKRGSTMEQTKQHKGVFKKR